MGSPKIPTSRFVPSSRSAYPVSNYGPGNSTVQTQSPWLYLHNSTSDFNHQNTTFYYEYDNCYYNILNVLYLTFTAELLTTLVGFPANLWVLYILVRGERSTSDIFTGSLALLDSLFSLLFPLDVIHALLVPNNALGIIVMFLYNLGKISVGPFLSCICVDRYIAVVHPTTFLRLRDNRYRIIATTLIWTLSLSYCIFNMHFQDCCYFMTVFCASFLLIIFCNVSLLKALMDSGPVARDNMHPVKKRAFLAVLSIFLLIIFTFLPTVVFNVYFLSTPPNMIFYCVYPACFIMFILRISLQPILALYHIKKLPWMSSSDSSSVCC